MVKGYLETAGIIALVQGDILSGMGGGLPIQEASPTVWVSDPDYERAVGLVEEFFRNDERTLGQTLWRCPTCGEYLEPQFTDCWNCGASRVQTDDE
ncbi:MAG: DUF2007 domain-containing protein [Chloroflexaceae bacterium]|nr:DUF2007 domain-containing protein [Chloroflexaceae bacterium]